MITEEIIQQACNAIQGWESDKKIIIGIEGYSGTGKSTLLRELEKRMPDILAVHRDDFMIPRKAWRSYFANATDKAKALEYMTVDIPQILEFAEKYRQTNDKQTFLLRADESSGSTSGEKTFPFSFDFSKRIMVIEGIWLFHPHQFDQIFDYRIYLDANQDAADERRRKREMVRWGDRYFPDTHPDNYFRLIKVAYNDYLKKYRPRERADLVMLVD